MPASATNALPATTRVARRRRAVPWLFFILPGGAWADRFDRRHVAAFANGIDGLVAVLLAVMTWADALNLPPESASGLQSSSRKARHADLHTAPLF